MVIFALIGMLVNGVVAFKMSNGQSMNEKVVYWHILEDVLGWAAVLVGGIILYFYETPYIDPVLSLLIAGYILWGVIKRLIETMHFFLQGVPKNISLDEIMTEIHKLPNVAGTHHTHIWSLDGSQHVFTTHVKLKEVNVFRKLKDLKESIKTILEEKGFTHFTIEIELDDESCNLSGD
jgi:cobalt-zinc-cadmium efflux system protein